MSVIETRVTLDGPFEITKEMNVPTQGEMAVTVTRLVNGRKVMWSDRIDAWLLSQAADPWEFGDNIAGFLMLKLNHAEGVL